MERIEKRPTTQGSAEMFTGTVFFDPIAQGVEPARVRVSAVHFTPGARTAWHRHARGQHLFVTEGAGWAQARGGDRLELRAGDTVWSAPDEWHWHGATPTDFMTHLSITEGVAEGEGPESEWGAKVTDEEYGG
jgi:quercetin dioxygenase-like cupin family protein